MNRNFCVITYNGRPAVYDKVARVFYTGFKTYMAARKRADALNNGE